MRSVVLQTKVPFNKSDVIALQVELPCQFGLIDVTLHLRSTRGSHCRDSFTIFGLITLVAVHCLISTTAACY